MATLYVHSAALLEGADGEPVNLGDPNVPAQITVDGLKYSVNTQVINSSGDNFNSQVLWQAGDGGLSDFDFLWFKSDQDVILELRNDNGTDQYAAIEVEAGVPFMLGGSGMGAADGGSSVIGADGSATTLDTIDQITVKNNATGAAANVTANVALLLVT